MHTEYIFIYRCVLESYGLIPTPYHADYLLFWCVYEKCFVIPEVNLLYA